MISNIDMHKTNRVGASIAFAVVVMGVLLSFFAPTRQITNLEIAAIIVLATCYVFVGIYGFGILSQANIPFVHLVYFACQILLGISLIFLSKGKGIGPILFLPLIGQSVTLLPPRTMIGVNGIIALAYLIGFRYYATNWDVLWTNLPWYLTGQVFVIIFLQMAVEEDKAQSKNLKLLMDLEQANENLRRYASQIEELTISRERNRIAREIHDGVGHYLTVINMQIQAAEAVMMIDPSKAKETLSRATTQSQNALMEIRKSVTILREGSGKELLLSRRLRELLDNICDCPIQPEFKQLGTERPVSAQSEQAIYRTAQEGIQNVIKHAQAENIWIILDYTLKDEIRLTVRDNGIGRQSGNTGFGLIGLEERMRLINGSFRAQDLNDGGFEIVIEVPE